MKVLSLIQDLISAASNGTVPTLKHVGLSLLLKHKTNLKQLITLLNHAEQYSEIREMDKSLVDQNIANPLQTI